jgi:hypothetical protein
MSFKQRLWEVGTEVLVLVVIAIICWWAAALESV